MPKDTLLAEIEQHLALAQHHGTKAADLLRSYQVRIPDGASGPQPIRGGIAKSFDAWIDWVSEHGPSLRQDIWDGTGINLATTATKHTIAWADRMAYWEDDAMLPDSLCRITGLTTGRGRPPTIYFLWSQRYDVLPKFGVGPAHSDRTKIDPPTEEDLEFLRNIPEDRRHIIPEEDFPVVEPITADMLGDEPEATETLLGVIHPPEPIVEEGTPYQIIPPSTEPKEPFDYEAYAARIIAERDGEKATDA